VTALGRAVTLPTCAHCGWRNASRVIDGKQSCWTCFPDLPDEDPDAMPATGGASIVQALTDLGDATIAELALSLEGDAHGSEEERAQFIRVRGTVERMVRRKVVAPSGRRDGAQVYILTGTPFVSRRGRK
jgi:hypothetical protein